jgi:biopolymer transport protein ExbB
MLRTAPTIRKRIGYLATLGNVATLLGLLGTIFGLIQAFEGVSMADPATKQEILARGISIAMLTTAFGLIVAIPCLLFHAFLQNKSMQMIEGLEEKAFTLFNKISALHRDIEKKDVRLKMKSIEGGRRA